MLRVGNPGTGKSHLPAGLAAHACAKGYKTRFFRVTELVTGLIESRDERALGRLKAALAKLDLLVLDELHSTPATITVASPKSNWASPGGCDRDTRSTPGRRETPRTQRQRLTRPVANGEVSPGACRDRDGPVVRPACGRDASCEVKGIESFNGRLRDEFLNSWQFDSLLEARVLIEDWRIDYNNHRPHSAHGDLTPTEFATAWTTRHQPALA